MKKTINILVLFFFLITAYSCKKTKLDNDLSYLVGSWRWIGGYDDNGSTDYTITFKEKGTYVLTLGKNCKENGRLNYVNNYLKFTSDNLFRTQLFLDKKSIKKISNDTIDITKVYLTDQPFSVFVKN